MYICAWAKKPEDFRKERMRKRHELINNFKGRLIKTDIKSDGENEIEYLVRVEGVDKITTQIVALLCSDFCYGGFCYEADKPNVFRVVEYTG